MQFPSNSPIVSSHSDLDSLKAELKEFVWDQNNILTSKLDSISSKLDSNSESLQRHFDEENEIGELDDSNLDREGRNEEEILRKRKEKIREMQSKKVNLFNRGS